MFRCERLKIVDVQRDKKLVDISFEIKDSLALVGESGSGKSLTLKALLGLLPPNLKSDMKIVSSFELKRGKTLSLVPQNPFTSLSPLTKIKDQFLVSQKKALELMNLVGLKDEHLYRFPPELSGGQLQRVIIAMALALNPKLLLLDEPTTALDPDTKEMVIELIKDMKKKFDFLILFVTHDIESARKLCKEISVIKKGKIVENGKMEEVLYNPQSEYTKTLIESNFAQREWRK
ncbi:ATP-binding cassette domain-containing protein [Nitrosophilus kaiyonis]|uniref:ATP-binding cassette domain-containing protein n=1 Tax=Nitrosophilus kaiyonis TaxID=2930200 RepID=UPI00248F4F60|nr:ATP-binding cassette domain-containing protein [Nitrosophilus kaiyonis]